MLVVEGPNYAGKSTLCATLVEKCLEIALAEEGCTKLKGCKCKGKGCILPPLLVHHTQKTVKGWRLADYKNAIDLWQIADRFHVSELVYGSICRDGSRLSPRGATEIRKEIAKVGGFLVILCASEKAYDLLLERHYKGKGAGKCPFSQDQLKDVNRKYGDLAISGDKKLRPEWYMQTRTVLPRLMKEGDKLYHALEAEHEVNAIARAYCANKPWKNLRFGEEEQT